MILVSCDKEFSDIDESKINRNISVQDRVLIDANNKLSIDLLRASFENNDTSNFLFSPVSTGMALGMLYNGVGEAEREDIEHFAGLESLELTEINKSYNQLLNFLELNDGKLHLTCANSMWFSSDISINENYRTTLMAYYDAEVSEINFSKKASIQLINNWGHLKTNGLIPGLITSPPAHDSRIVVINAFGVNTSWNSGNYFYDAGIFSKWDGQKIKVPTVYLNETYAGISNENDLKFLEFGLNDENLRFTAIQLQDSRTLVNLLENFSPARLENLSKNANFSLINLSIPKLPVTESISMKPVLSSHGLTSIFSGNADLSPSFINSNKSVTDMEQTALLHFNLPERLNAVNEFTNPDLPEKSVNLPFLYFITEKHTGTILFAGYFITPSE